MSLRTWEPGTTHFKHDEPSRVDEALAAEAEEAAQLRKWNAEIDARDRRQCRACGKHSDPDVMGLTTRGHRAHIVYASAGGTNEPSNRVTLCSRCHNDEHKDRLRFTAEGGPYVGIDASKPMEFWRKQKDTGEMYLDTREVAIGKFERD